MDTSIVITIADGKPYRDTDRLHCVFDIREKHSGEPMTDRLEFHCIQLDCVDISGPVSELGPVEMFAAYLKYAADEDKAGYLCELLEYGEGVLDMAEKVFKEVTLDEKATFHSNSLCSLLSVSSTNRYRSLDEKAWIEKRSRELAEHNRASELAYAREEALEQGLAQGEASGRAAEKLEMARAMKVKEYSVDEILELTGLSIEEIEKL